MKTVGQRLSVAPSDLMEVPMTNPDTLCSDEVAQELVVRKMPFEFPESIDAHWDPHYAQGQ